MVPSATDMAEASARESERIASFVADFVRERHADGVALGLSGGLDSSVVAALCAKAIPPERVHALILPERDSSPQSSKDARRHAESLGIHHEVIDLTAPLGELGCYSRAASGAAKLGAGARMAVRLMPQLARRGFLAQLGGGGGRQFREFVAFYRMKHRLRMVKVHQEAEEHNLVAASCANRTEFETGFFVRYGDDAGDFAPIRHLYKTQVRAVGGIVSVPEEILSKAPSPDLFAGMADEDIMGITYERLDRVLDSLARGMGAEEIHETLGLDRKTISFVEEIRRLSTAMRSPPAVLEPPGGLPLPPGSAETT